MCNEFWRCANSLKLKLKFFISTQEYIEGYLKKLSVYQTNLPFIIIAQLNRPSLFFLNYCFFNHCTDIVLFFYLQLK